MALTKGNVDNILVMGKSGAGKQPRIDVLTAEFDLTQLSTGDVFREYLGRFNAIGYGGAIDDEPVVVEAGHGRRYGHSPQALVVAGQVEGTSAQAVVDVAGLRAGHELYPLRVGSLQAEGHAEVGVDTGVFRARDVGWCWPGAGR